MSEGELPEDIALDTKDFVNTFCEFHKAFPDENQHIFGQITAQIKKSDEFEEGFIPSKKGQEEIWVFRRGNVRVYKRVFHPGAGERPVGADFVLYKKTKSSKVGATAVQVKRNRNKNYFEFDGRDLKQLSKLRKFWRSAYYLMVDETVHPPLYCFLTVDEVAYLVNQAGGKPPVKIMNKDVRMYCRGLENFYELFYRCNRGSSNLPADYDASIINYVKETKRVIVELSTQRENNGNKLKTAEKPKEFANGRIRGFVERL